MSESEEPEVVVPPHLGGGVFANDVSIFADPEHVTLDFVRIARAIRAKAWSSRAWLRRLRAY